MTPDLAAPVIATPTMPQRWQELRLRHVLPVAATVLPMLGLMPFLIALFPTH